MLIRNMLRFSRRQGAGLASTGRRLQCDRRGSALVEAALVFPLMIGLFLGISEFGDALTVSRRVEATAGTGADLVARLKTVATSDLNQIRPMLQEMIEPYPTAAFGLVITSVVADADNNATVAWSYADGAGVTARAQNSAFALPAGLTEPGSSVIVTEVSYRFRSTLATLIAGEIPMSAEAFMRPRLVTQIPKTD